MCERVRERGRECVFLFHCYAQFVVMGGSSGRMKSFAEFIAKETNHPIQTADQLDISRTDRFFLYKIGPILSVNVSEMTISMKLYKREREGGREGVTVQWNLSNPDTNGAEEVSLLVRCPHFRG